MFGASRSHKSRIELNELLTGAREVSVALAVYVNVSVYLGVAEFEKSYRLRPKDVLHEKVAHKANSHSRRGDIIRRYLLVKSEKNVWGELVLFEELECSLTRVVLVIEKNEGQTDEFAKVGVSLLCKMTPCAYILCREGARM